MLTITINVKKKTASVSYTETLDMTNCLRTEKNEDGSVTRCMADQDVMAHALYEAGRLFKDAIAAYSASADDVKAKKAAIDAEYANCQKICPTVTMS